MHGSLTCTMPLLYILQSINIESDDHCRTNQRKWTVIKRLYTFISLIIPNNLKVDTQFLFATQIWRCVANLWYALQSLPLNLGIQDWVPTICHTLLTCSFLVNISFTTLRNLRNRQRETLSCMLCFPMRTPKHGYKEHPITLLHVGKKFKNISKFILLLPNTNFSRKCTSSIPHLSHNKFLFLLVDTNPKLNSLSLVPEGTLWAQWNTLPRARTFPHTYFSLNSSSFSPLNWYSGWAPCSPRKAQAMPLFFSIF